MHQIRYFQPASDETPNPNPWHAFRDDSAEALCESARISYNRDSVADAIPEGGELHKQCLTAMNKEDKAAAKAAKETEA
jgi:hypothetical protein